MSRTVITGVGIVTAIGQGRGEFSRALRAGRTGIVALPDGPGSAACMGAPLRGFDLKRSLSTTDGLPANLFDRALAVSRRLPLSIQVSIATSLQAWCEALGEARPLDPSRTAIIVAGHNISPNYAFDTYHRHRDDNEFVSPEYGLYCMDSSHLAVVSELLALRGEGAVVGGASASGNIGILQAHRLIQCAVAEACLVVAPMVEPSPIEERAWMNLGAMLSQSRGTPETACRPFDRDRAGFVAGQGCACLVLESESSALQRGALPLAELASATMCLDGNRLANPSIEGEARAMSTALVQAGISPGEVQYINAHGTASPLGDEVELAAIERVFGSSTPMLWINSTKSLTGHCLYAAGAVEAVAAIEQIHGSFVHPNLNLERPLRDGFRLTGQQSVDVPIDTALSNSFGFGGINTSIVLRSWPHERHVAL